MASTCTCTARWSGTASTQGFNRAHLPNLTFHMPPPNIMTFCREYADGQHPRARLQALPNAMQSTTPMPTVYHRKTPTVYHPMPHCLPPLAPLSTTPCPAVYHPIPRCLPTHGPLSTTSCPAGYHPILRCLPPHAPLATTPYTHIWRSEGGARCSRGGENPTETCTYPRTGPGSRHGHGA